MGRSVGMRRGMPGVLYLSAAHADGLVSGYLGRALLLLLRLLFLCGHHDAVAHATRANDQSLVAMETHACPAGSWRGRPTELFSGSSSPECVWCPASHPYSIKGVATSPAECVNIATAAAAKGADNLKYGIQICPPDWTIWRDENDIEGGSRCLIGKHLSWLTSLSASAAQAECGKLARDWHGSPTPQLLTLGSTLNETGTLLMAAISLHGLEPFIMGGYRAGAKGSWQWTTASGAPSTDKSNLDCESPLWAPGECADASATFVERQARRALLGSHHDPLAGGVFSSMVENHRNRFVCEIKWTCPAGNSCHLNAAVACPEGHQCSKPLLAPKPCAKGTYSLGGATVCTPCPAGSRCPNPKDRPERCPDGSTSDEGQAECAFTHCGPGAFGRPEKGVCQICPKGHWCTGYHRGWLAVSDAPPPEICEAGRWAPAGASSCTLCPAGRFGDTEGLFTAACSGPCEAGYECPPGSTYPSVRLCPQGTFSPQGSEKCSLCPPGTYGDRKGLVSEWDCKRCPAGQFGDSPGLFLSECSGRCLPGYACPEGSDKANQEKCAAGTYSEGGVGVCTPCPAGKYGDRSCLTTRACSDSCPGGYACPKGSKVGKENPCGLGKFAPKGSGSCLPCPRNKRCEKEALETPEDCQSDTCSA